MDSLTTTLRVAYYVLRLAYEPQEYPVAYAVRLDGVPPGCVGTFPGADGQSRYEVRRTS
jgi:hypothetical protein